VEAYRVWRARVDHASFENKRRACESALRREASGTLVKRILILEGTPGVGSHSWRGALSQAGYHVTMGALNAGAELNACDLLIADAALARGEASELRAKLQAAEPRPKVLFVVRDFTAETVLQLSSVGDLSLPYPLESSTLLNALRQLSAAHDHVQDFARTYRLSPREVALLRLAVLGRNNDQAAAELGCSRATVGTYWNRVFRKTGVSGQRDVIILLLRQKHGSGSFPSARAAGKPLASGDGSGEK
jgi:DNA-binding NarL/FixJ family response regulator